MRASDRYCEEFIEDHGEDKQILLHHFLGDKKGMESLIPSLVCEASKLTNGKIVGHKPFIPLVSSSRS